MTIRELCRHCMEYDEKHQCDIKDRCTLLKLLKENKRLKAKIKEMEDAEIKASWVRNPDRMGW